ncbi:S-adenosyl-L-methionine-dependent methyltransferase family protein [Ochrobactrum quorumnocens]|uniref:S-adenosyl-L-methionine-dependent methyltransferase family protein n=1 Tax=Ochrobactrum quorumnocens TaxID=271865 RepID=A0A248UKC5_9HYPH|nr:class I SAM-dependent methyltransferase [[Ochrobactrum] quorumnocens]ASV87293.1 S-adenosyl-L-methionine-dependent methyltransferase family protein [[Ochrobactrum] quorumnocens]
MPEVTLKDRLKRLIGTTGPISVADYMTACLGDRESGYYTTREPFGRDGDFITAPEVSQMFGELIGIWCVGIWDALGLPDNAVLCEIGPGRGTLMSDMLRTIKQLAPQMFAATRVAMVETSPRLIEKQKEKLSGLGHSIEWFENFSSIPDGPLILVSNELFDAIPFRQFVKANDRFVERLIALDEQDEFQFVSGAGGIDEALLPPGHQTAPEGTIFEAAPARTALMQEIAQRIAATRGAALTIDYGHLQSGLGDTLQAMLKHAYDDVFAHPGEADLTSHVDFDMLERTARNCGCKTGTMTQGDFLLAMGLIDRAGRLGTGRDAAFQNKIREDVERLAAPDQMGTLFKALAIADPATAIFPFETALHQPSA